MGSPLQLDRRAFLMGVGGTALALPVLDAMGAEAARQILLLKLTAYSAQLRASCNPGMRLPAAVVLWQCLNSKEISQDELRQSGEARKCNGETLPS